MEHVVESKRLKWCWCSIASCKSRPSQLGSISDEDVLEDGKGCRQGDDSLVEPRPDDNADPDSESPDLADNDLMLSCGEDVLVSLSELPSILKGRTTGVQVQLG